MRRKALEELHKLKELENRHKLSLAQDTLEQIKKITDKINNLATQEEFNVSKTEVV